MIFLQFKMYRILFIGLLLFTTVGCDQATKVLARDTLRFSQPRSYLGGSIKLQSTQNPGAFLSLGSELGHELRFWVFNVGVSAFLILVCYLLASKRQSSALATTGLTLLLAGGIGNLIDRLQFGSVTDFLHLDFGFFHTGIFNFADVAIVIGVLMLLVTSKEFVAIRSH